MCYLQLCEKLSVCEVCGDADLGSGPQLLHREPGHGEGGAGQAGDEDPPQEPAGKQQQQQQWH